MTRDEVMALTDEELRIKAAELAGWREVFYDRRFGALLGCPPNADVEGYKVPPDYAHDIAAAWKLVKQLERAGFKISVHTGMIDPMTGDVLDDSSAAIWNHDNIYWVGTAGPGESPRAITRAFVLAMTPGKP